MVSEQTYLGPQASNLAALYQKFQSDPNALDEAWRGFFGDLDDEARALMEGLANGGAAKAAVAASSPSAAPAPTQTPSAGNGQMHAVIGAMERPNVDYDIHDQAIRAATLDSIRALMLIRAYRVRGHLQAKLDPLGLAKETAHSELDPETYGFGADDMDRHIFINFVLGLEVATLKEIVEICRKTYCDSIGVEFMHIQEPDQKAWIQERIENIQNRTEFTIPGKRAILERLTAAECFEKFLDKKFTGTKRFVDYPDFATHHLVHDPGAGTDSKARRTAGSGRGCGWHAAPRPLECLGELHGQALQRDLQ